MKDSGGKPKSINILWDNRKAQTYIWERNRLEPMGQKARARGTEERKKGGGGE